jgi:penicillin amidase
MVVNALIALAVIAVGIACYWFLYRALPDSSGTIAAAVSQPVQMTRDSLGVPHIKAATQLDALFAQGYATAEDRMWHMDMLRRYAAGETAEVIGPAGLETDRESRRMRMRRTAELIATVLPADEKAEFAAYARGVNAYIESHRGRYGLEFTVLQYDPRPWSVVDSILVGLQMFRSFSNDWRTILLKQQMMSQGERAKVEFLFPIRTGGDVQPGSNAWAIAGSHTATGKPMLSTDMHVEFSLPGIWYMTHLEAPGLNVEGVAVPGIPGIAAGHNDRIAWGETVLGFSAQDLYVERVDLRAGRYLYQGQVLPGAQDKEIVRVRGGASETLTTLSTKHGPVFYQNNNIVMSLRWTAFDASVFHSFFLPLDRAQNWTEFRSALDKYGSLPLNFLYADVDGNIGYQVAGKLPIRRNFQGDVPVDGSSGNFEWAGYIPFEQLPSAYNPPSGYLMSSNQNPFPKDYPYPVAGRFAPYYRSRQVSDLLHAAGNKVRPEDSLRIQKDVYSGFSKFIAQQVVAAWDKRAASNPPLNTAAGLLRHWNGQMDQDHPEPLIATLVYQQLRRAAAERAAPGSGKFWDEQMSPAVVERLLRERPRNWFADYDQLLLQAFNDAIEEGQRMQGTDPAKWRWGRYMYLPAANPVAGRLPLVGRYFNIGPVPMSGSTTTVKQTSQVLVPSERMDMSTANWDDSLWSLTVGQSGHVISRHYRDQWNSYYTGRAFPMPFRNVDRSGGITFTPAP